MGPSEELEEVPIDENDPTRGVKIGKKLKAEVRVQLIEFLRRNRLVSQGYGGYLTNCDQPRAQHG